MGARAPEILDAYRKACRDNGKEEGEFILHSAFAWGESDEAALEGARRWKPTHMPEVYRDDIHDPVEMQRMAAERVSDEEFAREGFRVGADLERQIERIREMEGLGATVICLQVIGQADPVATIRAYGERVLPEVRGA